MNIERSRGFQLAKDQKGSVLVVSLIFLLLLTMIGVASIQSSTLEERMAGNLRDQNNAFQAAEGALRVGEKYLNQAAVGEFAGAFGRYLVCAPSITSVACRPPAWSDRLSSGWVSLSDINYVSAQPQYIIEKFPEIPGIMLGEPVPPSQIYRITSRGFGVSDSSMVVLQTSYRRN